MKLIRTATAGTLESSDAMVTVEPQEEGRLSWRLLTGSK